MSDQARSPGLPRIAVVGTGRMGTAMVTRLSAAGARPIVYNRTRSKAEALADLDGVSVADTPREAAGAEIVVVSLGDDAALLATYQGGDGLVSGLRSGSVIVDTSTVDPQTVLALSPQVEAAGGRLLDAPVSGSVPLVEKGELTFMVGGDAGTLDRVRPVLEVLGRHVFHVGGQGAGAVMKLAVNTVVMALNQTLSEALVLAERAGVERSTAYDVLAASAVGAPFVQYKRPAFEHPDQTPVAFSLDLVAKDLDLIVQLADRLGVPMHQAVANRRVARAAIEAGLGAKDMSAVAGFLATDQARR